MEMDLESAKEKSAGESDSTIAGVPDPANQPAASSKKRATAAEQRRRTKRKTRKVTGQSRPSAPGTSKDDQLVCRYCGSDDLSPSFQKRRDARCRACFKKRYATTPDRTKKTSRGRRSKAAD